MSDSNIPDDCYNRSDAPWNQEEQRCPDCDSLNVTVESSKDHIDIECEDCGYIYYDDRFD